MPPDHRPRPSNSAVELGSGTDDAEIGPEPRGELWSWLPRLSARQVRLERSVASWSESASWNRCLDWLNARLKSGILLEAPEVLCRVSGLKRPGLIAQFRIPRWDARLAVGLETSIAHAVVDGLLGYDRPLAESRLQLTPVEWGVWSYLAVLALAAVEGGDRPREGRPQGETARGPGEIGLLLDRVGPDPFDPTGLGAIVTVRWSVRIGEATGTARLWIAESALARLASDGLVRAGIAAGKRPTGAVEFASSWAAEAGLAAMPHGLKRLRRGGVIPLLDCRLGGTPQDPTGALDLVCRLSAGGGSYVLPAEPLPGSAGRFVRLTGPVRLEQSPRPPLTLGINSTMTPNPDPKGEAIQDPEASPTDIPVTLAVELGRLNLTLGRLADLRPGDVLELGRHSREPVELTSSGRLVARGELVLIDTELGVRITNVFL